MIKRTEQQRGQTAEEKKRERGKAYEREKEQEIKRLETAAGNAIRRAQKEGEDELFRYKQDKEPYIEELEESLAIANQEKERQRFLNNNLKRIARERANAARGIKNKKINPGYIVLGSRQYVQRYKEYNGNREHIAEAQTWKTTIQTPYDASIPVNQIKGEVFIDLIDDGLIASLQIYKYLDKNAIIGGGEYTTFEDSEGREENGVYNTQYHANYRSGFWEIDIFHTKSITVPEEMRPPRRK